MAAELPERIMSMIDAEGDCWQWTGGINTHGYGNTSWRGRLARVHRVVWETLVGPVPADLELDHLCRNKVCVNPDHLEPVTHAENLRRSPTALPAINARKTHCHRGHPLSGPNLFVDSDGRRGCRTCRSINKRRRREARETKR